MVAPEIAPHGDALRIETLSAGDEFGWSSVWVGKRKLFQARALEPVEAPSFDGNELCARCASASGITLGLVHNMSARVDMV